MYSEFSNETLAVQLYEQLNIRRPNILGVPENSVFTSRPKADPKKALDDIAAILDRRKQLARSVEFDRFEHEIDISICNAQLLRSFGSSRGARTMRVHEITSGKSGAKVYSVTYFDENGLQTLAVIAKCDYWQRVETEESNFAQHVNGRLEPGTYAPLLNREPYMCGKSAAMYYQRIDDSEGGLAQFWGADRDRGRPLIERLKAIEAPWISTARTVEIPLRDLRRLLISDQALEAHSSEIDISYIELETTPIRARMCLQHGDFHAGNILVSIQDQPYIIDFANIAELPAGFDAVTLELAYIFNNPERSPSAWPTAKDLSDWRSSQAYFEKSPASEFLKLTREWADECMLGLGQTSLYGCAYAYCMRQFQYPETDKKLLNALIKTLADGLARD